jgi:hypothetical protein
MQIKTIYFFYFLLIFPFFIYSQDRSVASGVITDSENNEPLPFASIRLKNYPIGTISNENGEFDFYIPKSKRNDTISISFIGFNPYEIAVTDIPDKMDIKLNHSVNLLDEVILSRFSPLDYIKKALENLDENYPQNSYQTIAYYREKFIENGNVINKEEGIFKTYYPDQSDSVKNQHQLLLYKPAPDPQQFQFMRDWIDKRMAKEKKKAEKKGEEFEDFDESMDMDFGGPETILNLDLNQERDPYLDPKHFKKYEYTFGEETILDGESIITINFKAKRKINYMKDQGRILIGKDNYAIILVEATGKLSIPFVVRPILFAIGLKIEKPEFNKTISYQKYNGKWYSKLYRWDADVSLTKRHTFKSNEHSKFNIGQVFFINKIDSLSQTIAKDKRFDTKEDMENQVYNDLDVSWDGMNVIKD